VKMAKNLVLKATSDDRDPPQGPVLKELESKHLSHTRRDFPTLCYQH
jgi:hypothetical protein